MSNPLDSLRAAHDAGYVHGLIAGGLVFGALLLTVTLYAWALAYLLTSRRRPDPVAHAHAHPDEPHA